MEGASYMAGDDIVYSAWRHAAAHNGASEIRQDTLNASKFY